MNTETETIATALRRQVEGTAADIELFHTNREAFWHAQDRDDHIADMIDMMNHDPDPWNCEVCQTDELADWGNDSAEQCPGHINPDDFPHDLPDGWDPALDTYATARIDHPGAEPDMKTITVVLGTGGPHIEVVAENVGSCHGATVEVRGYWGGDTVVRRVDSETAGTWLSTVAGSWADEF